MESPYEGGSFTTDIAGTSTATAAAKEVRQVWLEDCGLVLTHPLRHRRT